eukprot:m51a1_g11543 putative adenylate guanylate cyclase (1104) ;mRNA; f:2957-7348
MTPLLLLALVASSALGSDLSQYFGTARPYVYNGGKPSDPLPGCALSGVYYVSRHGSRYPTAGKIKKEYELAAFVQRYNVTDDYKWMREWSPKFTQDEEGMLSELGAQDLYVIGARFAHNFKQLLFPFTPNTVPRTAQTAAAFTMGAVGNAEKWLQRPWVAVSESKDVDRELRFFDACDNYLTGVDKNKSAAIESVKYESSVVPGIAKKIEQRTGLPAEAVVAEDMVARMWDTCSLEQTVLGKSRWCSLFDAEDAQHLEFVGDIDKYYTSGYGIPVSYRIAAPLVQSIFKYIDNVVAGAKKTPRAKLMFAHAETLLPLKAILGLHKDVEPLAASWNEAKRGARQWRTSEISTMATNMAFVVSKCQAGDHHIQLVESETPVDFPRVSGCKDNWYVGSRSSTASAMDDLVAQVGAAVLLKLDTELADAEHLLLANLKIPEFRREVCDRDGSHFHTLFREFVAQGFGGASRAQWYVGGGHAATGAHTGTYADWEGSPLAWVKSPSFNNLSYNSYRVLLNSSVDEAVLADLVEVGPLTYDTRRMGWYRNAWGRPGQLRWGSVYIMVPEGHQALPVSHTVDTLRGGVGPDGNLTAPCGVFYVAMTLDSLGAYFRTVAVGKTGSLWIVDAATLHLISSSTDAPLGVTDASGSLALVRIDESSHALTRAVGRVVADMADDGHLDDLESTRLLGRDYFVKAVAHDLRPGTGLPAMVVVTAIPRSDYFGRIDGITRATIAITLAMLFGSVALSALFAFLASRPLKQLSREMVSAASLGTPRTVSDSARGGGSRGNVLAEIDTIQQSMVQMWRMLSSFHKYVPVQVLRAMLREGREAKLGVARRHCTTMFCDIENFTAMTEQTDPGAFIAVFTSFMDAATACVEAHGGIVDKIIGDCVMAFWEGHEPLDFHDGREFCAGGTDKHEASACGAAVAIRRRLAEQQELWRSSGMPVLECRIGMASGNVLVGNSGSSTRFNYTVLGPTVNLAARLEALNKALHTRVLVSEALRLGAGEGFEFRKVCTCRVKGIDTPHAVYELLGAANATDAYVLSRARVYEQAIGAFEAGDLSEARDHLELYVRQAPEDLFAGRLLAMAEAPQQKDCDVTAILDMTKI